MHERDVWLLMPIAANIFWLIASIVAGATSFPHDGVGCLLVALLTSGVAIGGIFGFVVKDVSPGRAFLAMLAQTCVLILTYSVIYFYRLGVPLITYWDALYYSVVTWTSLGYADLVPTQEMKVVTAVQAITGYLYLGLLVSVLSSVVGQARSEPSQ